MKKRGRPKMNEAEKLHVFSVCVPIKVKRRLRKESPQFARDALKKAVDLLDRQLKLNYNDEAITSN
jgi:predicted metal-dependent hydrolase